MTRELEKALGSHPLSHFASVSRVIPSEFNLVNRTHEVRGSIPLSSTRSKKGPPI